MHLFIFSRPGCFFRCFFVPPSWPFNVRSLYTDFLSTGRGSWLDCTYSKCVSCNTKYMYPFFVPYFGPLQAIYVLPPPSGAYDTCLGACLLSGFYAHLVGWLGDNQCFYGIFLFLFIIPFLNLFDFSFVASDGFGGCRRTRLAERREERKHACMDGMDGNREDNARGQNVMNLQTWYVGGDVCRFFSYPLFYLFFFLFLHR